MRDYLHIRIAYEEEYQAVDRGGGFGGRVEFQEDVDEDPEGRGYDEAGEKGLAAAESIILP